MVTLTQNVSLLHDSETPFVGWSSGDQGKIFTEDNVYDNISSIFPIALHEEAVVKSPLVSKKIRDIFVTINMAILSQVISVFGVIANIINIVVFIKQGFGEAMTVTLTGLAVADLGTVTCQMWLSICWNPWFHYERLKLPFRPLHIEYLSAGHPRLSSVRISAWILALATFERCLCITIPFKVREIITPRRARVFVVAVFAVNTACAVPFYYTSRIVPFFDTSANRSYLVLSFTDDRQEIDSVFFAFSVSLTVISFVAVALCTAVLVYSLEQASKWRESVKTSDGMSASKEDKATDSANSTSTKKTQQLNKNKRAAKMVSLISTIFIVCSLPNTVNQLVMSMVPEYAKNGGYVNINQTFWSLGYMAETVNASINIFMYYSMSTRYRTTIQDMVCARCFSAGAARNTGDEDGGPSTARK
ncbi:chemosensory receptor A [Elysia marginata]|uniref:Chemosensory receptor A n=1 Tax=Elysia marginata TaxID=1093978 RepID=A0AAV4GT48_9GAST|nr:chemosensory receptor A [Elysia marginata]